LRDVAVELPPNRRFADDSRGNAFAGADISIRMAVGLFDVELLSLWPYMRRMPATLRPNSLGPSAPAPSESPAERVERLQREAAIIARAHADIDAGLGIEDDDLEAWLERLDQDENAPLPIGASEITRP